MFPFKTKTDWKYFSIEVFFFLFICYLSPILSDLEYSHYEEHHILNFTKSLEARFVWGTYSFVFYGIYYWFFLKDFVFRRKVLYILVSIALFIICSHIYDKYVENWSISRLTFLSDDLRAGALKDFNRTKLAFIVSYTLNRIVFVIVGFAFLIRSMQQDEQLKTLKEEQLSAELTYLKAQLQPHFFFNTLNNIYALASKQSKQTAPMVSKLADMMRYIIYESDARQVALGQDISFIENYVEIERIRHSETVSITFDIQGVEQQCRIEPLLLLPFIENAFKHGLQEETGTGFVNIVICVLQDEFTLEVNNSKPKQIHQKVGGMGLQNVKKRLALLYPNQHQLEIEDDDQSYRITLTLMMHD